MSETCALCGDPIELLERQVCHEVTGYERDRKQGGTNVLRLRQRTGRIAHVHCVDRQAKKVDAHQESLL